MDSHKAKRRWSSIELGATSANHLIESVARDFDFNLTAPRVRRRSIGRRSAIDLLNHPEFDLKELEKYAKEAEEDESCEQERDHSADYNVKTCTNPEGMELSTSIHPSTASSETPSSSFSSLTSSKDFDEENKIKDKKKKNKKKKEEAVLRKKNEVHLLKSNKQKTKTKTIKNSGLSSMYRSLSMPTPLSLAAMKSSCLTNRKEDRNATVTETDFTNEQFYVTNNHDREWLGNESNYSSTSTMMKTNSFLEMLGSEIQTRYEKYREDQKIKETRKLIIEAARKRESLNLRNLVPNHDDYE